MKTGNKLKEHTNVNIGGIYGSYNSKNEINSYGSKGIINILPNYLKK